MSRKTSAWILPILFVGLSACSSTSIAPTPTTQAAVPTPPPAPAPVAEVNVASLPGEYGLASFQRAQDKDRTLNQAKIACRNPYKMTPGSNGGVVMHAPGQPGPAEFFVKKNAQGQSFLGPKGEPGGSKDQRIVSYQNGTLMTEWMTARLKSVYGTMVYVPCAQS